MSSPIGRRNPNRNWTYHPEVMGGEYKHVFPRPVTSTSKYKNKRCVVGGYEFHSLAEGRRYAELLGHLEQGRISNLTLQPKFPIIMDGIKCANYVADFAYFCEGERVIEDVKGFRTAVYRLKKRLVEAQYKVRIVEITPRRGKVPAHLSKWFRLDPHATHIPPEEGSDPSA